MSQEQLTKLITLAHQPPHHGQWSRFCLDERLTKDEVFHWRKKLGLPMRCSTTPGHPPGSKGNDDATVSERSASDDPAQAPVVGRA